MARRVLQGWAIVGLLLIGAPAGAASATFDTLTAEARASMMRDPAVARARAASAAALVRAQPASVKRSLGLATAEWLGGEASLRLNDLDRAYPAVQSALSIVQRFAPNTKLHGDVLLSLGGIERARSAPDKALRNYQTAHRIYQKIGDARQQAIALAFIGSIYGDAEDSGRVLYYYSQAAEVYRGDPAVSLSISNNRANALTLLGRFAQSEAEYRRALKIAEELDSPLLQARILNNIAVAQIERKNLAGAKATVARGLALANGGEAAGWKRFLLGTAARIALNEGRAADAVKLIESGFASADGPTDTQPYRSMHDIAYRAYKAVGRSREALAELETHTALDEQGQSLAASTNSALLAARFDFANQNGRIAMLKAGQLERDIALTEMRARQTLIVLGSALLLVIAGAGFLAYNLRTLRRSRDKVAAANAELTIANTHLEEALKAKSQFLATTSHEIRTPLNGILGMAQVLLAEKGLLPDVRERIELLHGAGTTMRALVDDILDFAALDAGRLDIQRSDADLRALLREIAAFWRGPATKAGLDLILEIDDGLHLVHEDVRRLRQILFNLVSNAIKFTPEGQVTLRATVASAGDVEHLCLDVIDSGIGVPAAELDKIFEEFHQVDTGRTRQFSGSGLGLAISRALAAAMDGTIAVRSAPGAGSTFTLRLPLRRVEPAIRLVAAGAAGGRALCDTSLLVIAGNPLTESTLRALLGPRVASFAAASGIDDAIELCRSGPADLILVEGGPLQLTGDDGIERLAALVAGTAASGVAIALLWKRIDGLPLPAIDPRVHVILKPIGGDALITALEKMAAIPVGVSPETPMTGGENSASAGRVPIPATAR